ncbi:MAG: putative orfan [Terrestrivirus sp.]|uniref:Putative orfan n=1 Tax=Terrestrivirus sp. TaxID=2487775 RepID=A0A3G4ZLJ7_9VIRU|nr:MAG: putative orfan [Terrestrivirus sp.]
MNTAKTIETIESIEQNDWMINNEMKNDERFKLSVSAYYLHNWYNKVHDITFETVIYPITTLEDSCPDNLPFERCMARYENKSPKDSEFWGPITNKQQLINIFNTSLRCVTNKGNLLCIRKWQDDWGPEFRCFWNKQLVCVGDHSKEQLLNDDNSIKMRNEIIDYIDTISSKIPYKRCVFDIVKLKEGYKFIEFNSWESNSGANPFDWVNDTELLYPDFTVDMITIHFRSLRDNNNNYKNIKINVPNKHKEYILATNFDINKYSILRQNSSTCLVTDKYLYVMTDIWLGLFNIHDLSNICWKRGVYRFCDIVQLENNIIQVGDKKYNYDLSPIPVRNINKNANKTEMTIQNDFNISSNHKNHRYGFYCKNKETNKIFFCRLLTYANDFSFIVDDN